MWRKQPYKINNFNIATLVQLVTSNCLQSNSPFSMIFCSYLKFNNSHSLLDTVSGLMGVASPPPGYSIVSHSRHSVRQAAHWILTKYCVGICWTQHTALSVQTTSSRRYFGNNTLAAFLAINWLPSCLHLSFYILHCFHNFIQQPIQVRVKRTNDYEKILNSTNMDQYWYKCKILFVSVYVYFLRTLQLH